MNNQDIIDDLNELKKEIEKAKSDVNQRLGKMESMIENLKEVSGTDDIEKAKKEVDAMIKKRDKLTKKRDERYKSLKEEYEW